MIRRRLLLGLIGAVLATPASAAERKLLTIGNSFSANATRHLAGLAKAAGHTLIHQPLVIGGASLEVHAEKARRHEADPTDPAGLYPGGLGLREHLRRERWDAVTIQQASLKSHDAATYQPHSGRLAESIARHAPQARLLIHQTWAYRADDPRFTRPSGKPGEPRTRAEMHRGLTAAYDRIATALGGRVIPVGDAFHLADTDPAWGFRPPPPFDAGAAVPPALPDQTHSLHVGWTWRPPRDGGAGPMLAMDGHHANLAGEYLGSCVWFEVLFGESPVGNAHLPKGLDPAHARFLQETAHRAVQARLAAGRP